MGLHKSLINYASEGIKVIKYLGRYKKEGWSEFFHFYLCECRHCGKELELTSGNVKKYKSCGCHEGKWRDSVTKHGLTNNPLHKIYKGILNRCYNPDSAGFRNYGARGIYVCEEWLNSFKAFSTWAIKEGWFVGCGKTIDRIDVNGPYSPENCRYSTPQEQCNNRTTNILFKLHGEVVTIRTAINKFGPKNSPLTYLTVQHRLLRGWTFQDAVETPVRCPPVSGSDYNFSQKEKARQQTYLRRYNSLLSQ